MFNTYLLSYDPFLTDPSSSRIVAFVRSNLLIYQFFVPSAGVIILKSQSNLQLLLSSFSEFFAPHPFILTKIEGQSTGGRLDQSYWNWLNSDFPPALPVA